MYKIIEDRGCGITYEVGTFKKSEEVQKEAINYVSQGNLNGNGDPYDYTIENVTTTILGHKVEPQTRGIFYLCDFSNRKELKVINEIQFDSAHRAIETYVNIPNPESQVVTGKSYHELCDELEELHERMKDPKWLKMLDESI